MCLLAEGLRSNCAKASRALTYLDNALHNSLNAGIKTVVIAISLYFFTLSTLAHASTSFSISAQQAIVDEQKGEVFYSGEVEMSFEGVEIIANEVRLTFEGELLLSFKAVGAPAELNVDAETNKKWVKASAESILYNAQAEELFLEGAVIWEEEKRRLQAPEVRYEIKNGNLKVGTDDSIDSRLRFEFYLTPKGE